MNKVTIKDVAREAGVSISTVSNALNNSDLLLPATREHVLKVAERLNYTPDHNGQNLRSKKTRAIGLFVSALRGSYYGVLADTMHIECQKYGYELYIYIINNCRSITDNILGRRVDGAVILYEDITDGTLARLAKSGCPVVFLDREYEGAAISSIVFDSFHVGEIAANYLISLGHRDLMHVAGVPRNYDSVERQRGFFRAIEAAPVPPHGEPIPPPRLIEGLFERGAAFREMKRYLNEGNKPPDAIFASNDLSAIGCIEALRDAGIRVPEDVSVIGCDDIDICELLRPPMTTVRTRFESQGVIAVELLMGMLKGGRRGLTQKIESRLIIRDSCRVRP
ncbi:MAG: LacI family transcriptional regulator [Clostridiales bacterium]|jgi:LacI family purine nucleotide synthesis repressor|nr:LacI family transcriptional regulator [Clostridiales bacterium]